MLLRHLRQSTQKAIALDRVTVWPLDLRWELRLEEVARVFLSPEGTSVGAKSCARVLSPEAGLRLRRPKLLF